MTAVGHAQLGRCDPREQPEGDRERIAVSHPRQAAEDRHAGPREHGVPECEQRKLGGNRAHLEDELEPRQGTEEDDRGPGPEGARIGDRRRTARAAQTLHECEERAPGVHDLPHVAGDRREIRESHPPGAPDRGRRQVPGGVLTAADARRDDQHEQGDRTGATGEPQSPIDEEPTRRPAQQVDPGIAPRGGPTPPPGLDDHEGEPDHHRRTGDPEREGNGQDVAIAEAVGQRGRGRRQRGEQHRNARPIRCHRGWARKGAP